jgi:putative ABC transport system substrate-binding protein
VAAPRGWHGRSLRAQQPAGKLPIIGFLGTDAAFWRQWADAITARLRELGWIEGRTVAIKYRWSEGRPERTGEIAAEFVRLKVDVIVTNGISASTLKRATAVIPIVFALGSACTSKRPKGLRPPARRSSSSF